MIAAFIIVLACAILNRMRGDDRWMPTWLPGRSLYYVAPAIGAVALLVDTWSVALAAAAAYFFWAVWPWGRWFDLGRLLAPASASNGNFESIIEQLAGGSDHRALFLRHLMATPGLWLLGVLSGWPADLALVAPLLFAGVVTLAYELAWRSDPSNPIWLAELTAGAIWAGVILACSASFSSSSPASSWRTAPVAHTTATTSWTEPA
jgi:hypothetical protein